MPARDAHEARLQPRWAGRAAGPTETLSGRSRVVQTVLTNPHPIGITSSRIAGHIRYRNESQSASLSARRDDAAIPERRPGRKGELRDRRSSSVGFDGVVPFGVERVALEVEGGELLV